MRISLDVSEDNECTSFPWWVIVDPRPNMSLNIDMAAAAVVGPFFSREEAEETLASTRYNYSKRAVVYCKSGYYSRQYKQKMREAERHWADKPILRELFWFLTLPHSLKKYLRRRNGKAAGSK